MPGLLPALGPLRTLPVPPSWVNACGANEPYPLYPPSPCQAREGSGREPGLRVIPPSCSPAHSVAQGPPFAPGEPPAPHHRPPCRARPQQGLWKPLLPDRHRQRDAAAKHPSSFASPSPVQPQPRAQHLWGGRFPPCQCRIRASSPRPRILPIAAGGCSTPFLAVFFPAAPCAAGWEWYGPPSSARFSWMLLEGEGISAGCGGCRQPRNIPGEGSDGSRRGGLCSATALSLPPLLAGSGSILSEEP